MFFSEVPLSAIQNRRIDSEYYDTVIWNKLLQLHNKTEALSLYIESPYRNPMCYGFSYVDQQKIPFIRIDNLNSPQIEYENVVYISEEINNRFSSTKLKKYDIVMGVRGNTIGRLGVYTGKDGEANFSPNVIRLRLKHTDFVGFLAFYLVSEFGQRLIKRETSGTGQPTITADLIEKIQILKINDSEQNKFNEYFFNYFEAVKISQESYNHAKTLLESELGLDQLRFQKPVGYTARFSEMELSRRLDAQHYQAQFTQLLAHLAKFPSSKVRDIRICNRRGIQPVYVSDGAYDVINSQHLGPKHINYDGLQKTSPQAFAASPVAHIRENDLLIYTTGAYIGRTNVYLSDNPAFASNHVNILRVKPDIDAAYMAMVFQSVVGQFQTQKHSRGSAQAELYPNDIDKFVVPILPFEQQTIIGDLVRESLVKQRESARLLEQAKARVEQLIEAAV